MDSMASHCLLISQSMATITFNHNYILKRFEIEIPQIISQQTQNLKCLHNWPSNRPGHGWTWHVEI